ncbi:zonular occludens toxin domain-containing protein [Vibrio campbellii]|uniref:zonular occludens toxin domain-containing protein n=1 Tax=Vibrio campbellii TaxID=680 RepID=UPI0039892178
MAVIFRHGSNGSYKSAYATWFEILPALREGRLVVTNIEGLRPKMCSHCINQQVRADLMKLSQISQS